MKYEIELDDQAFLVEIEHENGRGVAAIDNRTVSFDVTEPEPGVFTLLLGNRVFEVRLVNHPADAPWEAICQDKRWLLRLYDPKERRRRGSFNITGQVELKATMPGRVVCWLCQPGDPITEGQGVVVVEAMKMQNELRSPKTGRVADLLVEPGQIVNAGEVLAVID